MKILSTLVLLVALAVAGVAQDRGSVYGGVVNLGHLGSANFTGFNAGAEFKVVEYEGVKLSAVADFSTYHPGYGFHSLQSYLAGAKVSYAIKRFEPFGRVMIGATNSSQTFFATTIGGGLDVKVTDRVYVTPFFADFQTSRVISPGARRIGARVGFNF